MVSFQSDFQPSEDLVWFIFYVIYSVFNRRYDSSLDFFFIALQFSFRLIVIIFIIGSVYVRISLVIHIQTIKNMLGDPHNAYYEQVTSLALLWSFGWSVQINTFRAPEPAFLLYIFSSIQ